MRAAVTGGSGVVGSAVVRHLVEAGHSVAALARSETSAGRLRSLGAEPSHGDVLDGSSLRRLAAGSDVVFHVAGVNELCSPDPSWMWRVNVDGTRAVMAACRDAGVARMVHTSSAVTIGEAAGATGTEETPHRGFFLSEYERSKAEAERLVLAEADGLDVVSVNPSSVQGPGRATGTGRLFLAAAKGRLPFLFDTRFSLVDIDDCARGHLLAAERGAAGERYLLSGAVLDTRSVLRLLADVTGKDLAPRYVRPWLVRAAAAAAEWSSRLIGRRPPLCRETARVMLHGHAYDGSRARRELGLEYTPVEDTISRTVRWFEQGGMVPA